MAPIPVFPSNDHVCQRSGECTVLGNERNRTSLDHHSARALLCAIFQKLYLLRTNKENGIFFPVSPKVNCLSYIKQRVVSILIIRNI